MSRPDIIAANRLRGSSMARSSEMMSPRAFVRSSGLARGEQDDQRAATAVDRGVDLRAQPAARPAESVIARFVPAAARILVIQRSPYVLFAPRTILPNTGRTAREDHATPPRCDNGKRSPRPPGDDHATDE